MSQTLLEFILASARDEQVNEIHVLATLSETLADLDTPRLAEQIEFLKDLLSKTDNLYLAESLDEYADCYPNINSDDTQKTLQILLALLRPLKL